MNIGIYIYDQAEVLDFSGPYEVFTTASRICLEDDPFQVFLISESGKTVHARAGYEVNPHYGFHNHPNIDLLIVVGGFHYQEINKESVLKWIADQAKQAQHIASVCSGAWLLAAAGVLTDESVTTHWEDITALQEHFPRLKVLKNRRWIEEGKMITSAGISAGIDMSLYLVQKFHSSALAAKTARQMEYEGIAAKNNLPKEALNRIEKRAIEALAMAPVIRAMSEKLGREEALAILKKVTNDTLPD